MRILIETIPHEHQRYETTGDYWVDPDGTVRIVVSDMGNDDYAFLVAIHELVERHLNQRRGISDAAVTEFDKQFESRWKVGDPLEPGDEAEAPYQNEHNLATGIERIICAALGVKWADYERAVYNLSKHG